MHQSYLNHTPLKDTTFVYNPVAVNAKNTESLRQNLVFLDGKPRKPLSERWWKRVGWPAGAFGSATMATIALFVNLSVMCWTLRTFELSEGFAQVFAGNCDETERINMWAHLAINAVSTLLLSGSNYCMQILSAPTRKEIDKAHAWKQWLDVGVPSIRNLKNVERKKVVMWGLLGLSSIPLHMMYNSVFFSTIATNEYDIIFATEEFAYGDSLSAYDEASFPGIQNVQTKAKTWDRLEKADCINAYGTEFINRRRGLVAVVVDNAQANNNSVMRVVPYHFELNVNTPGVINPYAWICDASDVEERYGFTREEKYSDCSLSLTKVKANAERWHSSGWDIDYCLSEPVEGKCSLNFSVSIMVVVMVCNVAKVVIMLFIAFRLRDKALITVGDAIDSFLAVNDPTTEGICLISKERLKNGDYAQICYWKSAPLEYISGLKRWSSAISTSRWWACMALFGSCMITVASLLAFCIISTNKYQGRNISTTSFLVLSISAIHPSTLIDGLALPPTHQTIANVLIANVPQLILSFNYLLFNGLFTTMLLADEWSSFAHERKPLRVSDAKPGQRSTYFLQLPYRYAIPLIIFSGILHWSVSQSLFLAQIASFDKNGNLVEPAAVSTCGYSPVAIAITMIIGTCLAVFVLVLNLRRYRPGIPLAGSCSAAISAACHGRADVDPAAPLQWGVVSEEGAQVGHCAFSDQAVSIPTEGALYAGHKEKSS